jgi:hypothetical protein
VRGLTRSDAGAEQLKAVGAEVHRGDLQDIESLRSGATGMDAVGNLAFNHDMSKFAQNAEDEIKAIEALGSVLEPGNLLVVTSGIGTNPGAPGQPRKRVILRRIRPGCRAGPNGRRRPRWQRLCMSGLFVCPKCMTRASRDW